MSFPNPDDESPDIVSKGILLSEAMTIYDESLNLINPQISMQDRDMQRKAFLLAFLLLDDYVEDSEEAREAD